MASLFTLFGKLMQSDKSINKEGIGLGLYIARRMVIQLGGTLNVQSQPGKFTRFVMTLPVQQSFEKLPGAE
jgi:signal transduction histidine kinase